MAFEWENRSNEQEEVVEHLYSPVVESIAFLSTLMNPEQQSQLSTLHSQLLNELDPESTEFLNSWERYKDWSFLFLFNYLLPCPYYYDAELFQQKVATLSDCDFLYHFFGESIPQDQLEEFIKAPDRILQAEVSIWWETEEKRANLVHLITTLSEFRKKFLNILVKVNQSTVFQQELEHRNSLVKEAINKVKTLKMEPLSLAQYIMGKTFRRTSLYQVYQFIPSYFFSTYRMRIFDSKSCIVIYGVQAPLQDLREKSAELELQVKALSDRNRILILKMLSGQREYGAKIAEYLGITTATVSHHLELLKKAGFVKEEKVGTIKYFSYNQEHTESILNQLQEFISPIR
ncbi:ArsR/SmtB family transcription factor [Bacillus sp. AK128]